MVKLVKKTDKKVADTYRTTGGTSQE